MVERGSEREEGGGEADVVVERREREREREKGRNYRRLIRTSGNWHGCTHLLGVPDSVC